MKTLVAFLAFAMFRVAVAAPAPTPADKMLEQYFRIHKSLAADSTAGVPEAAANLAKISNEAAAKDPKAKVQLVAISQAAVRLKTTDLKTARNEFGELSNRVIAYVKIAPVAKKPLQFYCSMVKKNWLQPDKSVRNPYYGSSMLTCGELVK
jgi:hypothetical protein